METQQTTADKIKNYIVDYRALGKFADVAEVMDFTNKLVISQGKSLKMKSDYSGVTHRIQPFTLKQKNLNKALYHVLCSNYTELAGIYSQEAERARRFRLKYH